MTKSSTSLPIAVTCGDPSGVGPEVIAGALRKNPALAENVVLIGPQAWAEPLADSIGSGFQSVGPEDFSAGLGQPTVEGAALALAAMESAAEGCRDGRYRAVATGPVSKEWLQRAGFSHPGQTEFFSSQWGAAPTMAFVGRQLRVVLATWHIPLRKVPDALDAVALERAVRRAFDLAGSLGREAPRIGVCGLNPHAGEGGLLGQEEREVLDPALDRLREEIPGLSPCLPGDTVFHRQVQGEFDVVVAAYHDQALAAVKTLEFDSAVNVTLGLPFIRTSPDHGTAFSIAGQGRADFGSMQEALLLADRLSGGNG
ncbi:MAG: 4-hydroxythreonine-4-phosphate dehydrogenase PdxA [Coraliomargaritaceae bacterium]